MTCLHFRLYNSILLVIKFHCTFSLSNEIQTNYADYYCILIRIIQGVGTLLGFITCLPYVFFPYSRLTPHLLIIYLSYFILAVPMLECLGEHSCMSSTFEIAILKGACFFFSQCNYKCTMCIFGVEIQKQLSTGKREPLN